MNAWPSLLIDVLIIFLFLGGISLFYRPKEARTGNLMAACAILAAFLAVLLRNPFEEPALIGVAVVLGGGAGWLVARAVNMIQIPAMVAFQHGAGGIAAFLISFVELIRAASAPTPAVGEVSGFLGLVLGASTFSGSMVASGKLANLLNQKPVVLRGHSLWLLAIALMIVALAVVSGLSGNPVRGVLLVVLIGLSIVLGIVFSIRIGGADMPILISFLNATAGLAAAFCGIIIENRLLVACGATVAASGSILTHIMCRAINRGLTKVFVGIQQQGSKEPKDLFFEPLAEGEVQAQSAKTKPSSEDGFSRAVRTAKDAAKVIIIPGYGMALAQAQFKVVELARKLESMGKDVRFAIHPVAGRMPGHMNVLLAEAEVDYEKLVEMDEINPEFKNVDLALVVGACDVVNPAAIDSEDTPISGMPVLMSHEAKTVVVCNLDEKPGYSGVENPLYGMDKTITLFGDARTTVEELLAAL
ncbi:MAG: NAD(P)(+) transhydrogenase (Re/Si-specific) subunit beta [Desulfatiglandales bacterium]